MSPTFLPKLHGTSMGTLAPIPSDLSLHSGLLSSSTILGFRASRRSPVGLNPVQSMPLSMHRYVLVGIKRVRSSGKKVTCVNVASLGGYARRDGNRVLAAQGRGLGCVTPHEKREGVRVNAVEERRGGGGWPQTSLVDVCRQLQLCFFEVCVQNLGRSAGQALHGFVSAAVDAFMAGYTFDKLTLQLAYGSEGMEEFKMETAGYRLTASEEYYRTQWLSTIFVTLQLMRVADNEASRSAVTDDVHLVQIIHEWQRTLEGQRHGEEQSLVKFDRGLATKGASGGAVTEKLVIAPQWVPVTQLVLLTMKVVNES